MQTSDSPFKKWLNNKSQENINSNSNSNSNISLGNSEQ